MTVLLLRESRVRRNGSCKSRPIQIISTGKEQRVIQNAISGDVFASRVRCSTGIVLIIFFFRCSSCHWPYAQNKLISKIINYIYFLYSFCFMGHRLIVSQLVCLCLSYRLSLSLCFCLFLSVCPHRPSVSFSVFFCLSLCLSLSVSLSVSLCLSVCA